MNFDWDRHWWLIVILAVFAVPIVQALFAPWNRYLRYRQRRDAIEVLKVYAAQGKDPPPQVLDALGGTRRWRAAAAGVADSVADNVAFGVGDKQTRREDRWARREDWRAMRAEIRAAREPLQRWNWAIFSTAVTIGFAFAWRYAHANNDTYLIVAVIAGALSAAAIVTALLATFWRID